MSENRTPFWKPKDVLEVNVPKQFTLTYDEPKEVDGQFGRQWFWGVTVDGKDYTWAMTENVVEQVRSSGGRKGVTLTVTKVLEAGKQYAFYRIGATNNIPATRAPQAPQEPSWDDFEAAMGESAPYDKETATAAPVQPQAKQPVEELLTLKDKSIIHQTCLKVAGRVVAASIQGPLQCGDDITLASTIRQLAYKLYSAHLMAMQTDSYGQEE